MISGSLFAPTLTSAEADDIRTNTPDNKVLSDQSLLEAWGSPIHFDNPWMLLFGAVGLVPMWIVQRRESLKPLITPFGPMFAFEGLETPHFHPNLMKKLEKMPLMFALGVASIAAAGPQLNENVGLDGDEPILIAIDTDWAAAANWSDRREAVTDILRAAHNNDSNVVFLNTTVDKDNNPLTLTQPMSPAVALSYLENMHTQPWQTSLDAALTALEGSAAGTYAATYWMSNGIQNAHTQEFALGLSEIAPLTIYDQMNKPHLLRSAEYVNADYLITIERAAAGMEEELTIKALSADQTLLVEEKAFFNEKDKEIIVTFSRDEIGYEQVTSFKVAHEQSAGATLLVSENYKPRSVGIATLGGATEITSLLEEAPYLNAALEPYADIHMNTAESLLHSNSVSILIVPDTIMLPDVVQEKLLQWVEEGGTLVRVAGPNLAGEERKNDPLLPVNLRKGVYSVGDSLTSTGDKRELAAFAPDSPFAKINGSKEVVVEKMLLVEPDPELASKTWAQLKDGTPFVTADDRGKGKVVLFHTTVNTLWSEFPLTDMFVNMLVETVRQSSSIEDTSNYKLSEVSPISVLNGQGELRAPENIVEPLSQEVIDNNLLNPMHPPGFYGTSFRQVPRNIGDVVTDLEPLQMFPEDITHKYYENKGGDYRPWLWAASMGLMLIGSCVLLQRNAQMQARPETRQPVPGVT